MWKTLWVSLALLFYTSLAFGTPHECTIDDKTGCIQKVYKKTDQELNQVYQKVRGFLGTTGRKKLLVIQRTWLKYRDQHCKEAVRIVNGGITTGPEMSENAKVQCLERLTAQRTKEIKETYSFVRGLYLE